MVYTFQKVYTLIAQTPMIHFQYDQTGATLRATEVKPKLDQYLLKCAEKEGVDRKILDSWHIGYDPEDKKRHEKAYKGLHYQMKIEKKERPTDSFISLEDCKFYFGNQGDGDKKELVFQNAELQIICFIPALLKFIDEHIGAFFALHNFGTRQTKGFGSFRLQNQTDDEIEIAIRNAYPVYFYADMPIFDRKSIKNRMNHALTVYSVMKNGLNMTRYNELTDTYRFPDSYIKGYSLRPYFDNHEETNTGSDKAFIKSYIHETQGDEKDALDRDYENYTFIRAMLGLAEQYEFRDRYRNNGKNVNIKTGKESYQPVGITVIHCPKNQDGTPMIEMDQHMEDVKKEAEIQRFASPVTIKIYQDRIYFLFDDSYKTMLDQTFLFLSFVKKGRNTIYETLKECLEKKHYISTPKTFDMKTFVDSFVSYYNEEAREKLKKFTAPYENSQNLILRKGW